jgi:hypothetical protein
MKGDPMGLKRIILLLSIQLITLSSQAKLEAHEWGTFTSLVGSNGVTQNGMYHEDEKLPDFVHGFGEVGTAPTPPPRLPHPPECKGMPCESFQSMVVTQKMETPVIYFYSDRIQQVRVNVRFPEGAITETYPAPILTSPVPSENVVLENGDTTFIVKILPDFMGKLPEVEPGNIYAHARNVNSALVQSGTENEKFIFYRGLGRFQPRISMTSQNGALTLMASRTNMPQAAFLVHVSERGLAQLMQVQGMKADQPLVIPAEKLERLQDHELKMYPPDIVTTKSGSRDLLINALAQAGLYNDEAVAMVDTWENGYLKVPGLRMLYILPRAEVDEILPLTMTPQPDNVERVFVARIEILLDTEEERLLGSIFNSGRSQKEQLNYPVETLGRFAEPILHRLIQITGENTVLETLLKIVQASAAQGPTLH